MKPNSDACGRCQHYEDLNCKIGRNPDAFGFCSSFENAYVIRTMLDSDGIKSRLEWYDRI